MGVGLMLLGFTLLAGLFVINPNEAAAYPYDGNEDDLVEFDEDKKATMISNLLVVLCSEHAAQPVINTGTINQ